MKKLLFFLLLASPLFSLAQDHHERLSQMDVQNYFFDVTIPDEGQEITVHAFIGIKILKPLEEITLDLVGKADGKGMEIFEVQEIEPDKGYIFDLEYTHADNLVKIPLENAEAGQVRTVKVAYKGIPKDGLVISENRHGHRTFFGDNWPNRARNWLASVDHPSDKAKVRWVVRTPPGFECVANGKLLSHSLMNDGAGYYDYESQVELPTKVMVIGVADFEVEDLAPVKGISVSSWVFPEDTSKGFDHYDDAAPILQTFIDSIAPYAYAKLANVQSKTRYGGMENASSIFYYEASVDDEIIPLLAHEIAHQWFGNMATEADWHHIWLSEGFATYFTDLYIEWSQGEEAFHGRMERERSKVIRFNQKAQLPIVNTEITNYNRLLNPNSYEKGAWVLHMLRGELGYPVFMQGVRTYYERFGGKNALSEDLQAVMEEVSGKELDWFFKQWLYVGGHPELELKWKSTKGGKMVKLEVEQVQEGPAFQFDLEMGFEGLEEVEKVRVTDRKMTFELELAGKPKGLVPDPQVRLLADFELVN